MKKFWLLMTIVLLFSLSYKVSAESKSTNMKLTVDVKQTVTLGEGMWTKVPVTITNNSDIPVRNVTAKASIKDPDKVYIDGNGIIFESEFIEGNYKASDDANKKSGNFKIRTDMDFTSKTVPIVISIRYYIAETNEFKEQEETIYVRVEAPEKPINPSIEISKLPHSGKF